MPLLGVLESRLEARCTRRFRPRWPHQVHAFDLLERMQVQGLLSVVKSFATGHVWLGLARELE